MRLAIRTVGLVLASLVVLGATGTGQDWPQWRGPNRDNKVVGFKAPATWPKELTRKWKVEVGVGDASPVLVGDRVYTFTRVGSDETITCLDAGTGKEIWKDKYAAAAVTGPASGHAGPRAAPTVAEGKVCTFGVAGVLSCLDAATGKLAWRKDTKGYPDYYTAAAPLIADGLCVAYVGGKGKGEIVAYDLASGEPKWKWPGEAPSYGSPTLMTVDGTPMVVAPSEKSVVAVSLADGKLLWKAPFSTRSNNNTPIIDKDTVVYAAQGGGTVALKVEKQADGFAAKEVWKKNQASAKYNTPVLRDGLLFGLAAGGRGSSNLFCMDARTGETLWTDKTARGECGAVFDAGEVLIALTSDTNLVVFKPSGKEYSEVARYKVADTPPWAYPILAGNRIYVKDRNSLLLWTIE